MPIYGKAPVPEAVMQNKYGGNLSQRAANATRRRPRGSGGKGEYWTDTFKPHESVPANVRLIQVECIAHRTDEASNVYEEKTPWKEFREHYHGHYRRSGICSGGPLFFDRNRRSTCHGCDIFWESPAAKGKKRPISMSDKFAFAALVMDPFHKVPQLDERGQFRMNANTNQPYTEWERCLGVGCPSCRNAIETMQGRMQPWIMSKSHFNNLNAYSDRLGCLTCGGRATPDNKPVISTAFWQCGNPNCRQLIFDMSSTTATLEQIQGVVNKPYTCPFCQTTTYPEEVIQCANCTPAGQQPQRATIFDVDLQVIAPRTGDGEQTVLIILASSDPRPINPAFNNLLQYTPDLEAKFAPTPLEEQASRWQRNVQPSAQPQMYAQSYGAVPGMPGTGMAPQPMAYPGGMAQPMPQPQPLGVQPQPWTPPGGITPLGR
jgi:hypothetical protein